MKVQYCLIVLSFLIATSVNGQIFWSIDTIIVNPVYPANTQIPITVEGEMVSDDYGISNTFIQVIDDTVLINIAFRFGYGSPNDNWSASFFLDSLPVDSYYVKCKASLVSPYYIVTNYEYASFIVSSYFGSKEFTQPHETLILYPNPVKDELHIEVLQAGTYYISVYSFEGQAVFQGIEEGSRFTLPLANLKNGFYFLELYNEGYRSVNKFIVNN